MGKKAATGNISIRPENIVSIKELTDILKIIKLLGKEPGVLIHEKENAKEPKKRVAILSIENMPGRDVLTKTNIQRTALQVRLHNESLDTGKIEHYIKNIAHKPVSFFDNNGYLFTMMSYPHEYLKGLPILKRKDFSEEALKAKRKKNPKTSVVPTQLFNRMAQAEIAHVLCNVKLAEIFVKNRIEEIHVDKKRIYPIAARSKTLKAVAFSSKFYKAAEALDGSECRVVPIESLRYGRSTKLCEGENILRVTRKTNSRGKGTDVLVVVPVKALMAQHFDYDKIKGISDKIAGLPVVEKADEIGNGAHKSKRVHPEEPVAAVG